MVSAKYEKEITEKYKCKTCGRHRMYPNNEGTKIKGYRCEFCLTKNYPIRDALKKLGKDYDF